MVASLAAPEADKGWDVVPTIVDGQDAVMLLVLCMSSMIAWYSIQMAMFIATGGYHADEQFCEAAMDVMGTLFFAFFLGVLIPLLVLAGWNVFTDAASPYAAIGTMALFWILNRPIYGKVIQFQVNHTPLEFFHAPQWLRVLDMYFAPWLKHLMTHRALRPKAEKRAAKLRAQVEL